MDCKKIFEEYQDLLAPQLDTYEQALYLFIFRYTHLMDIRETTIGFDSALHLLARKIDEGGGGGHPIPVRTCFETLQRLHDKGCIKIIGAEHGGTRVRLFLPSEVHGTVSAQQHKSPE